MVQRRRSISLAALSLAAIGAGCIASGAFAQENGPSNSDVATADQLNKPINLDVKSANLYYALTLMFDQLKIGNYTLPDSLKQIEVSAHFTQLPIRTALETLLRNSGYTYKVDNGVYSVVPKIEEPQPVALPSDTSGSETAIKSKRIYRLASSQIITNSVDLVTRLGGRVLPGPVGAQLGSSSNAGLGAFGGGAGGLGGGLGGFGGGVGGLGGGSGQGGFGGGLGGFGGGGGLMGGGGFVGGGSNFGGGTGGIGGGRGGGRGF